MLKIINIVTNSNVLYIQPHGLQSGDHGVAGGGVLTLTQSIVKILTDKEKDDKSITSICVQLCSLSARMTKLCLLRAVRLKMTYGHTRRYRSFFPLTHLHLHLHHTISHVRLHHLHLSTLGRLHHLRNPRVCWYLRS